MTTSLDCKTIIVAQSDIDRLKQQPQQSLTVTINGAKATIKIAIPHYQQRLQDFYGTGAFPTPAIATSRSGIAFDTEHFCFMIRFDQPNNLYLHNPALELQGNLKALIDEFEVVSVVNGYFDEGFRHIGHRNRFPHLKFHRDRNSLQPTPYSLYTRDPLDPEQRHPRTSSTLFIPNIVAYLQCLKQRDFDQIIEKSAQSHYDIFASQEMTEVLGQIIHEHRWDEPEGTGEIVMLDNRQSLHASYLRNPLEHGYRIGVRYLC